MKIKEIKKKYSREDWMELLTTDGHSRVSLAHMLNCARSTIALLYKYYEVPEKLWDISKSPYLYFESIRLCEYVEFLGLNAAEYMNFISPYHSPKVCCHAQKSIQLGNSIFVMQGGDAREPKELMCSNFIYNAVDVGLSMSELSRLTKYSRVNMLKFLSPTLIRKLDTNEKYFIYNKPFY